MSVNAPPDLVMVHQCGTGKPVMVGWYCPETKEFYRAIGRERRLPIVLQPKWEVDRWVLKKPNDNMIIN